MNKTCIKIKYADAEEGGGKALNTVSVLETLKELRRWEQTTSSIESRLKEVQSMKSDLRERLRSLELTLNVLEEDRSSELKEASGMG